MLVLHRNIFSFFTLCFSIASAAGSANYSVQLMGDLAPSGWTPEQWAGAVDTMIGKTQAYILSDLIENLGIKLQITEDSIRESINADRAAFDLKPLPPYAEKLSKFDLLFNPKKLIDDDDDLSTYLPPGWTEIKLKDHSVEEVAELPEDIRKKLVERQSLDIEKKLANPNKGFLSSLPKNVVANITSKLHDSARISLNIAPGVRVYKREVAPLVQVVSLQEYDLFGFVIIRTGYANETAWESFLENLHEVASAQLDTDWEGTGMDTIIERYVMPIEKSLALEGATYEQCRLRFRLLKGSEDIPIGLDTGIVLVADEKAINALADMESEVPAYLWAVDTEYDATKNYPAGYKGVFEVRVHSLWNHLFVALGSGMMTPVDVWGLLQQTKILVGEEERVHDEL